MRYNYRKEYLLREELINSGFFYSKPPNNMPLFIKDSEYRYNVFTNRWFKRIVEREVTIMVRLENELDYFSEPVRDFIIFNLDLFT